MFVFQGWEAGYEHDMRFRLGFVAGFASGYYLGAMGGRERYEQINRFARKVKRSDTFEAAAEKAKDVVDLGMDRTKDMVDSKFGNGDEPELGTQDPFRRAGSPPPPPAPPVPPT